MQMLSSLNLFSQARQKATLICTTAYLHPHRWLLCMHIPMTWTTKFSWNWGQHLLWCLNPTLISWGASRLVFHSREVDTLEFDRHWTGVHNSNPGMGVRIHFMVYQLSCKEHMYLAGLRHEDSFEKLIKERRVCHLVSLSCTWCESFIIVSSLCSCRSSRTNTLGEAMQSSKQSAPVSQGEGRSWVMWRCR